MTPQSRKQIAAFYESLISGFRAELEKAERGTDAQESELWQGAIAGMVLTETALAEVGSILAPPFDRKDRP